MGQDKYILVCDGLYISENLMGEKVFFTLGAIRSNRIKGNNQKDIISNINEGKGFIYKNIKGNESMLVKFHHNKQFYIISNYIKK